jgi:hydrogenase maturation protease
MLVRVDVLVACFGNVLRGDDGFGVAVAQRLLEVPMPDGVRILEVGIGGIHMIHELLGGGVDALVVVDAADVGRPPGTLLVLSPELEDLDTLDVMQRRDALADTHYATPQRALTLASALGVMPDATVLLVCQAADPDSWGEGLSSQVAAAVEPAVDEVRRIVSEFGVAWA